MTPRKPLQPDREGKIYEEFWVGPEGAILRRRVGTKGEERLRAQGLLPERYETDGLGNPVDKDLQAMLQPGLSQMAVAALHERLRLVQKGLAQSANDPTPPPQKGSGKDK